MHDVASLHPDVGLVGLVVCLTESLLDLLVVIPSDGWRAFETCGLHCAIASTFDGPDKQASAIARWTKARLPRRPCVPRLLPRLLPRLSEQSDMVHLYEQGAGFEGSRTELRVTVRACFVCLPLFHVLFLALFVTVC
jgi:hypothetical protein